MENEKEEIKEVIELPKLLPQSPQEAFFVEEIGRCTRCPNNCSISLAGQLLRKYGKAPDSLSAGGRLFCW
jgi:hypothetical protein